MPVRNLFLFMILCLGSCAVATAQSLSGPLSFRFDLQGSPYQTLTPGPGVEFNGPSPAGVTKPWNWLVDINNLRVSATATLTTATQSFSPELSLEDSVTIPGYTITGVTFSNILPSGSVSVSDFSSTSAFRRIDFNASVNALPFETLSVGTQIQFVADFQVTPNAVPEPSTYALLSCGGALLSGYMIRRRRRAESNLQ